VEQDAYLRFQVLRAASMKMFRDLVPCSLVEVDRHYGPMSQRAVIFKIIITLPCPRTVPEDVSWDEMCFVAISSTNNTEKNI
jgi:hypothetical protein